MEKLGKNIQLPAYILFDEIIQGYILINTEALFIAAVHLVPLPEAYQNNVVFLVLYLFCQLPQAIQI